MPSNSSVNDSPVIKNAGLTLLISDDPFLKYERTQELIKEARYKLKNKAPGGQVNQGLMLTFDDDEGGTTEEEAPFFLFTSSDFGIGDPPNLAALEQELADPGFFSGDCIIKLNLKDFDAQSLSVLEAVILGLREGVYVIVDLPRIATTITKAAPLDPRKVRANGFTGKPAITKRRQNVIGYIKGLGGSIEQFYGIEGDKLLAWIADRARKYQIMVNNDVIDLIARTCENNLMVIDQSLRMMNLAFVDDNNQSFNLTTEHVATYFTQDSRYNGDELPSAIFKKDALKALNIINSFCNGNGANYSSALGTLIQNMDKALNIVYAGKNANVNWNSYPSKNEFFKSVGLLVFNVYDDYINAIRTIEPQKLNFLSHCLAEASRAYSYYDMDGALRALQRMALGNLKARDASRLSNSFIRG